MRGLAEGRSEAPSPLFPLPVSLLSPSHFPFPFPSPFMSLPSLSLPLPLPQTQLGSLMERCKLPSGVLGGAPAEIKFSALESLREKEG